MLYGPGIEPAKHGSVEPLGQMWVMLSRHEISLYVAGLFHHSCVLESLTHCSKSTQYDCGRLKLGIVASVTSGTGSNTLNRSAVNDQVPFVPRKRRGIFILPYKIPIKDPGLWYATVPRYASYNLALFRNVD